MVRSLKIINQVIWPPIITTLLYVFVFGLAIGSRISTVDGVTYAQFLIPGLIMLQVIDASYGECSSSLFQGRFMNSIQELLIAPLSASEMVAGFVVGSLARAFLIAGLITALGVVLVHSVPRDWALYLGGYRAGFDFVFGARANLRPVGREVRPHRHFDDVRHHAADLRRRRLYVGEDAAAGAAKFRALQSDLLYDRRFSP